MCGAYDLPGNFGHESRRPADGVAKPNNCDPQDAYDCQAQRALPHDPQVTLGLTNSAKAGGSAKTPFTFAPLR
jgi:hypothetical protein